MSDEALRGRLKAVREATGLKQQDFAAAADRGARALFGGEAPRYTQTRVSDLERGGRYVALEDIAVYASLDPLHRGKLWLGWGESAAARASDPPAGDEIQLADGLTLANLNRYPADVILRAIEALQREEAERAAPARPRKAANDRKRRR